MTEKSKLGLTESKKSEAPAVKSLKIGVSNVLTAVMRERMQTPEGQAELRRIGDKIAFSTMEVLRKAIEDALELAGGDKALAFQALWNAVHRPQQ